MEFLVGGRAEVRTVWMHGQEVPYWAAGGPHQPYEDGHVPRTGREHVAQRSARRTASANDVAGRPSSLGMSSLTSSSSPSRIAV